MCFLLGKNQASNSILVLLPGCAGEGGTSQRDMAVLPGQPQPHPSPSCLLPPSPAAPPVLLQLTIPAGAHCWAEGAVIGWVARRRSGRQGTGQLLWQRQQPVPHPRGVHTHPAAMISRDMLPRVSQGWLLRSCSSRSHLWKCRQGCSGAALPSLAQPGRDICSSSSSTRSWQRGARCASAGCFGSGRERAIPTARAVPWDTPAGQTLAPHGDCGYTSAQSHFPE